MSEDKQLEERRFFIGWMAVAVAGLAGITWFKKRKPAPAVEKMTMLTEDGHLVEIDAALVHQEKKVKVTTSELQRWVKSKP